MRLVAGGVLLSHDVAALTSGLPPAGVVLHVFCAAIGALLVAGLWTPVAGACTAIGAALQGLLNPADAGFFALLATLGGALALLGPGVWSVDARLFGWRRVEIPNGRGTRR